MTRKKVVVSNPRPETAAYVSFDFEKRTYQIDPGLKKVYRGFVEIETSRASRILCEWRCTKPLPA